MVMVSEQAGHPADVVEGQVPHFITWSLRPSSLQRPRQQAPDGVLNAHAKTGVQTATNQSAGPHKTRPGHQAL